MATHYGKFGIDANQPIDGSGNVAARLQNPDYIANTGVHWLRLNMVLPRGDFLSRYDAVIDRTIDREMKLLVAIGQDALGDVPLGDKLRDPNSTAAPGWIQQYVQRFLEIVERYRGKVFVYEAVNEPNGWQGGGRALIHPRWFVYLMNTLYQTIRPQERGIRLISGPLEATWLNDNEAARYLQNVLDIGGWASGDVPWDGVGYHIYVGESPEAPPGTPGCTDPEQIRATYATYLAEMWAVMRGYDPQHHHKLFITEFGWTSDGLGESYQTRQLQTGLDILAGDERVAVASIFCTEDFARKYGLYVQGMSRPKQAFGMVRQLMTTNAPDRTRHVNFAEL
ncbi:MAG: hypothetical protein JW910_12510, partial [Anaerolineae bacterium]|nr:hypothetical protein [Anaerolineae bacterium]